jgi:hypothetical protein
MKKSAIFTLLFALVLGLSLMSCGKTSDKESMDLAQKAIDNINKTVDDYVKWAPTINVPDPVTMEAIKAVADAGAAKLKAVNDAMTAFKDGYEKTWKAKITVEADQKKFDDAKVAAEKKFADAKKVVDTKMAELQTKAAASEAPVATEAPAPEAKKK